ncbi:MAG: phosphoadenylyl-sulfate reductase [Deltaproteobacteria bacterium]|nr:phosphoadenylyl-sulfate reductase [Deltaproteobacteria bacterium]
MDITPQLLTTLEKISDPKDLLKEIFSRFGNRAAIGTSGQLTGSVLIDMACQTGLKPRIFTLDTLRLFPETYELFSEVEKKYGIQIEKVHPDPTKLSEMIREHGEYLFFDSKEKQELCCNIRKVEPNEKMLETLDVWITGLRADQSRARASTAKFEIQSRGENKPPLLKVAPLVDWTEKQLRNYATQHQVPVHPLLNWNHEGWYYESLGCILCTTPIGPNEARRAGRWRWFNALDPNANKECGLHGLKKIGR